MAHLLKWHRIFHPRHHHGKATVRVTFRMSVRQRPTNQQRAHSVVQEESDHVECQLDDRLANFECTNLRSHEFWCTAKGACGIAMPHILFAKPIICNLDVTVERQQNVVEFQIPVRVKLGMNTEQCNVNLPIDDPIGVEVFQS